MNFFFEMTSSKKADWNAVQRFLQKDELRNITGYSFNSYDFAVEAWMNKDSDAIQAGLDVPELLKETKSLALAIAGEYSVPLERNAKVYIQKSELAKEIDEFIEENKQVVDTHHTNFGFKPEQLKADWTNTIQYEREIELYNDIETLQNAPPIVATRIEQGNAYDAAVHIKDALNLYQDKHFYKIPALNGVKDSLDECQQYMITHVTDTIFSELFVKQAPKGISFYKQSPYDELNIQDVDIDVQKIKEYASLLIPLNIQDDFSNKLKDQIWDRMALMMVETANSLKVKKLRQFNQSKDGFEELVDIAYSYNLSHPLVAFLDQLLAKMWVLLVRASSLDDVTRVIKTDSITFSCSIQNVNSIIRELTNALTSPQGAKERYDEEKLYFKFVSSDSTPMMHTASQLRTQLGIKPTTSNSIQMVPMINDFFEAVAAKFHYTRTFLPSELGNNFAVQNLFKAQTDIIKKSIDVSRPIKTEISTVPILISTPSLLENMERFISIAHRFPYLKQTVFRQCIAFIKEFNKRCADEVGKIKGEEAEHEEIKSSNLLSNSLVLKYAKEDITKELVINESNGNFEDKIADLAKLEENNEESLMNGTSILTVENTIRVKYHLPQVAAIAESLIVIRNRFQSLLVKYPLAIEDDAKQTVNDLNTTIIKAMVFLKLEIRCRTYADIVQPLLNGRYSGKQQPPTRADQYVEDFKSTLNASMEMLKPCLIPSRFSFVFIGIARLVYDIHIRFIPRLREIDDKGVQQLTKNLSELNQALSVLQYPETMIYKKALIFVSNITFSTDRILVQIQQYKDLFTLDEIEPVFNMEQKRNEKQEENLQKLRHILK